ncbi:hypothetical protein SDC9_100658 [bioreactor metagenome]|uniref:Uncharacterized protein n=1 Tax=bioreactor metagenome TaxID=1076179 RepID=A0A645AMC3_9ZZZZ
MDHLGGFVLVAAGLHKGCYEEVFVHGFIFAAQFIKDHGHTGMHGLVFRIQLNGAVEIIEGAVNIAGFDLRLGPLHIRLHGFLEHAHALVNACDLLVGHGVVWLQGRHTLIKP